jgi:DNA repair photolyase
MPSTSEGSTRLGAELVPVRLVQCRSAISASGLPGLDWALNPYRGCGHACAYCYAQDVTRFDVGSPWGETVEVKVNFVQRLRRELQKGAQGVYGLGTVTDPYQPLEKKHELTRGCLSLLRTMGARASILTKSDLVLRDIDLLRDWEGVEVGISISSLDDDVSKLVEPRAPSPERRLHALRELADDGINTYLMLAPVIRSIADSDDDLESIVERASECSVKTIMWDKYNPKPLASIRLRNALAAGSIADVVSHSADEVRRIDSVLRREGLVRGVKIVYAF